ncbi:hypothetical protein B0H21DRAFT_462966 [Amylocystis lapponica]|nr:hypothetical protein B0H21DRAFT_462966 [Amylocystis lapponica]
MTNLRSTQSPGASAGAALGAYLTLFSCIGARCASLLVAMGLRKRGAFFRELTAYLRCLCQDSLDMDLTWIKQTPAVQARFIKEAVETYPYFEKYENAWPVRYYASRYVRHFRHSMQRHADDADDSNEENRETKPTLRVKQNPLTSRETPTPVAIQRSPTNVSGALSLAGTSTPNSMTSIIAVQPSFATYLASFTPSLEGLAPLFTAAGITDVDCFCMLADWPESEYNELLRDDVGLNPYQFRLVRMELKRMQIVDEDSGLDYERRMK